MSNNQKEKENNSEEDDFKSYLKEMEELKSDFSDLDDLDFEEIQEMKDAITKVREEESSSTKEALLEENYVKEQENDYSEQKEAMMTDFTDLEEIDFDELREMKEAIETVKQEGLEGELTKESEIKSLESIPSELEERIKQELLKKKEEEKEEIITTEKFLDYIKDKRDKIWYHSLWYLVFKTEDQIASKQLLYDQLKEVTSKSPIDPIPEHQFYFGLGYILRLNLEEKKVVRYMSGGKFKLNIGLKKLKEILEKTGEPIITRPKIKEEVKKKMFADFLNEDFSDI